MAMPVLFPEVEGPQFERSDAVAKVAERVLTEHGRAGGVNRLFNVARAIKNEELHVAFLLNTKPFDPLAESITHDAIAKCIKAPTLWHDLTGYDLAIWVREWWWNHFKAEQREALLLHELLHVDVEYDDDQQVKLAIRKHDLEEFTDVARRFGSALPGIAELVKAQLDWQHEQDNPEPRPLRTIENDATGAES